MFIATLCGLAFALLTLGAEVLYYKRKQGSSVSDLQSEVTKKGQGRSDLGSTILPPVDTNNKTVLLSKASFAALAKQRRNVAMPSIAEAGVRQGPGSLAPPPGVAYISVFPRDLY